MVGAVGLWFDSPRRFLTASRGFKKDSLGGAVRWGAAGCVGGRRSGADTTARRFESLRTRWVGGWRPRLRGTEDQEQGLRRASATGVGAGLRGPAAVAACGRVCPGSPVAVVAVNGTIPSGRCPAGSHAAVVRSRPAGHRQAGLVVQAPPTATRDPGPPHLWEGFPRLQAHMVTAACACRSGPRPHHRGVVPDPSSLSAGVAKLVGPVVSSRTRPVASRCDAA